MNLSRFKALVLSCVATVAFVGCGGGSDSTAPAPIVATGTFVDAPVQGLKYVTATQNGYTDSNGTYKFVVGEQVEFFLGTLSLGKVTASTLVTPYTMAGDTNISTPSDKAKNIAMLLQNFDANRSDSAVLDVSKLKDRNFSDVNLSVASSAMETKITALLGTLNTAGLIDSTTHTLINATAASTAMKNYVATNSLKFDAKFTQAFFDSHVYLYSVSFIDGVFNSAASIKPQGGLINKGESLDDTTGGGTSSYVFTSDGGITVAYSSGQTIYFKVGEITSDYVQAIATKFEGPETAGVKNYVEYWYFDKAKADAKLASLQSATVSVESGFGAEWLAGRTLWTVFIEGTNSVTATFTFNNGKNTAQLGLLDAITSPLFNNDYTITADGIIDVTESGSSTGHQYYRIIAIDGTKISLCNGEILANVKTCNTADQWFFTTKASAQAYSTLLVP